MAVFSNGEQGRSRWGAICLLVILVVMLAGMALPVLTQAETPALSESGIVADQSSTDDADLERRLLYSRTKLALSLVATAWSWVVLGVLLFTGLSARLRDLSRTLMRGRRGMLAVYFLLFSLITALLALPLDFYSGFVIEHRFGLSTQDLVGWLADQVQGLLIGTVVGLPVVAALYWAIHRFPRFWWLGAAGASILLTVVVAALYPVVVAPLFNDLRPVQDQELVERIERLAASQGVEVSEVLQEDTSRRTVKVNAYFAGLGPTKRIVLTDNLLSGFTSDEIVSVLAHELGHQVHDDLWTSIAVGSFFYLVGFYLLYRLLGPIVARFQSRFGFEEVGDVASLLLLLLLFGLLSFAAMPALNGLSRYLERQADRYALELTQDGSSFASSMEKLGQINLSDPNPPRILVLLFYTHPPIQERVEAAQRFEAERK